jgi:hypothetical protein
MEEEFKIGDMFFNQQFDAICTITRVGKATVDYNWTGLDGYITFCKKVKIKDAKKYRKKNWTKATPLILALF